MPALMKAALLCAVLLSACASPQKPYRLDVDEAQSMVCTDRRHCDAMWQAAQLFVLETSSYKIQIATDVVIQTFGPGRMHELAIVVTRRNYPGGEGEIRMTATCGWAIYQECRPTIGHAGREFTRQLAAVR